MSNEKVFIPDEIKEQGIALNSVYTPKQEIQEINEESKV